jgi:putative phage-type endonuclease
MSLGGIDNIIDKIKELFETLVSKSNINYIELVTIKKQIYKSILNTNPGIEKRLIEDIINKFISIRYKFNKNIDLNYGLRDWEHIYCDIKVPKKYKKLEDHFQKLKNIPQPAQRTKEWFDYRHNRITASDTASDIDLNPYEPVESFILKKCDPDFPFLDNAIVFHGKKYEQVATLIYEHIYNSRIYEFGALPSDKYPFLGASPDGICSKYTLDNQFSDRLGTMLEIKCPAYRKITTQGEIAGNICPFYYYCQVQQQLACCELDKCDFWQCKITEYKSLKAYQDDIIIDAFITDGIKGEKIVIDKRFKKGIILEFYPKKFEPQFEGDQAEWKSKYIYPTNINMNEEEYNIWTLNMLNNYRELYPEIAETHYFYRIVYWKLEQAHNVTIERDDKFFNSILPILEETWAKVLYYREHLNELDELKKIVEERKSSNHPTTDYIIHNNLLVTDKCLFLEEETNISKYIKPTKSYNSSYNKTNKTITNKKEIDSDHEDFVKPEVAKEILETKTKPVIKKKTKQEKAVIEKPKILTVKSVEIDGCDFID